MAAVGESVADFCEKVDKLGVRYFVCSYTGLNENLRSVLIPRGGLVRALTTGAGGHPALYFVWPASEPEMYIIPDMKSFIQLPWKPNFGWMMCDIFMKGQPFAQCPRVALKKQIERAAAMGFTFKTGAEMEFVLTSKDGTEVVDPHDNVFLSYQETRTVMTKSDYLAKMNDSMEKLGWNPYQIDREGANCQYEMNFEYSDALTTADRVCFFKFMAKELAEAEGFRATFMPQLFQNMLAGTGMHFHMSLWQGDTNVFRGSQNDRFGLSEIAYHFLGGVLKHAEALTAFACPTVNSYRRLNNASWAPWAACYGGNNRSVLMRIPDSDRMEYRLSDGSCNPYLFTAAILAVGIDGIQSKLDPGEPCMKDISHGENAEGLRRLPRNLLDALRALDADEYLKESMGSELRSAFIQLRRNQWEEFMKYVTDWERKLYLDC